MTATAPDDGWIWLREKRRSGVASIGSLMIQGDASRDEHGHPHQVLVEYDEQSRAVDLLRDESGRPLTWILTADGTDHIRDESGRDALRPAPPVVAEAAEQWLADERRDGAV